MTREEFIALATTQPKRDEKTVFEVTVLNIDPARRKSFTRYPVTKERIGYSDNIEGAEKIIGDAISKAKSKAKKEHELHDAIYCFFVSEYPLRILASEDDYGFSKRLYDSSGILKSQTYCSAMASDRDTDCGCYKGRTPESAGFCVGDIVGVYLPHEDCVRVKVVTKMPPSIDTCWLKYKKRLKDKEDGFFNTDLSHWDDKAELINEMGQSTDAQTLNIMPLEVPLAQYLNRKFERLAQPYKKESKGKD